VFEIRISSFGIRHLPSIEGLLDWIHKDNTLTENREQQLPAMRAHRTFEDHMKTPSPARKHTASVNVSSLALFLTLVSFQARGQGGLAAHWKFDEGAGTVVVDSSTNGNNGTLTNGTVWVTGWSSNALSFDGVDDYVEVANSPSLGITGDITVAAWIKRGALGDYGGIVAKTDGDNIWDYDFYFDSGADNLHFWSDSQSPQNTISTGTVSDTDWHHVAATRSGETVTFYIDGAPAGTVTISGDSADNPIPVRIGTDGPGYSGDSMFNGLIDDVRIYNRALSASEIRALYPNPSFSVVDQPADVTEAVGYTTTFSVLVSPPFGLAYQWYKGTNPIAGATGAAFTTGLLTPTDTGSQYQVVAANATGLSVTSRVATLTVVPAVFSAGFLKREVYNNITGTPISDLTNDVKYPNAPDGTGLVGGFESPSNVGNDYGQRLSGYITPSESTNYIFYIASDDNGELWLSTDEDPAKKVLIATEPQWNPPREWISTNRRDPDMPENRSVPIPLVAGRRYYVEALEKEGGGDDNLAVTAIKEGDLPPANRSVPLQGSFIGAWGAPSTTTVTFTNQPQDVAGTVGKTVGFTAGAGSSSGPIVYQWQKNEADIFKATTSTYTTPVLGQSDEGARFRCIAYIRGGASATSMVARVTVSSDVAPPTLVRVGALADPASGRASAVTVVFDEPVDLTSAQTISNYSIDDGVIVISSAVLQVDLQTVVLSTAPINADAGADHKLVVKNVADRSPNRNAISQITVNFQATYLVIHLTFDNPARPGANSAGNGNDGTLLGQPALVPGQIGNALSLDGVDDYVEIPNSPSLGITGDITIAAWIKRGALGDYGGIAAKTDGSGTWDYDLFFASGNNMLHFYSDNQSPQEAISTGSVSNTDWHHVAVTRSGETVAFYIDAAPAGTVAVTGAFADNTLPVRIGTDGPNWSADSMFNGSIDDVRIYNRALAPAEILQFMTPAARLNVTIAGTDVVVSWPAALDLVFQSSTSLSPASWATVTNSPSVVGDQKTLALPTTGNTGFYRLRSP